MSLAKFNRTTSTNLFTKDTSNYSKYVNHTSLTIDEEIPVFGFYLNKESKYGAHYVAISDGYYVNLPASMNDTIADMIADTECIELLNAGNEKMVAHKVFSKKWNKDIIVVDFV